ncbi:IF-2-associated domain-containing protein, partial [Phenylobacterium soli]|uniref:IF-2-associated domain-containing protein n=1 Tax=Phenylobacterium soli TaxID=2170551 RepID=UPI00361184AB
MSDDNNNGRGPTPGGRPPLTLKPRGAGSVSAGTVRQSFSHGRSKTVVVETKRPRTHTQPAGNLAAPSSAERRVQETRPGPAPTQQAPRGPQPNDGLSAEERAARQRAIELARQQQERQAADRRAAYERARAEAEARAA